MSEGFRPKRPEDFATSKEFLKAFGVSEPTTTADELRQLREEIKALREELTPPKSSIVILNRDEIERVFMELGRHG